MNKRREYVALPPLSAILPQEYFLVEGCRSSTIKERSTYTSSNTNVLCYSGNDVRVIHEIPRTFEQRSQLYGSKYYFDPLLSTSVSTDAEENSTQTFLAENLRNDASLSTLSRPEDGFSVNDANLAKKRQSKKVHVCQQCRKKFSRPSALSTHLLIHSGQKPFACSWRDCPKKFNVKSNLIRHLKLHQKRNTRAKLK